MNAYIGPKTAAYLRNLKAGCAKNGIKAIVRTMQSNGGISTIESASELPIRPCCCRAPAGGVIGGRWTGDNCGKAECHHHRYRRHVRRYLGHPDGELRIKEPARH